MSQSNKPTDNRPGSEGFLSRWSRMKQTEPKVADVSAPATEEAAPAEPEPKPDIMPELPSLESLLPGQDISVFMHPAVPGPLRNAALRKMWVMDPAIRDFVSEALDYAYDYNTPGMAPGFGSIETTPEMIREVADMMDRAMSHHIDETNPPVVTTKTGEDSIVEGVDIPPQIEVHSTLVLGAEQQSAQLSQPPALNDSKKPEKTTIKPGVARRHGGALPS